ncbi:hypothetical protein Zmor_014383 [Zophobas morio]|uniref:Uncharacterized protein n=1 Tax=Zophobas morio TaxID=2755281 RepID=A0AA38IEL8_9CUCU|nr:hypothetical protein Zmor_014383 [Zophobas morio]
MNGLSLFFGLSEIDLFASRTNAKSERYLSWNRDAEAVAIDELPLSWKQFFFMPCLRSQSYQVYSKRLPSTRPLGSSWSRIGKHGHGTLYSRHC